MVTATNTTVSTKTNFASLKDEFAALYDRMVVLPGKRSSVDQQIDRIVHGKARYSAFVATLPVAMPWSFVALIHSMEESTDVGAFHCHLHNGDPLSERTVHDPAGRPPHKIGDPPFAWEVSARDALDYDGFLDETDWSVPHMLYLLEKYNGFGTRRYHQMATPYLWSFSNLYARGKYVADGKWSDTAVSKQMGAAVILKRGTELGVF